mgnify:CR=1 FL=1
MPSKKTDAATVAPTPKTTTKRRPARGEVPPAADSHPTPQLRSRQVDPLDWTPELAREAAVQARALAPNVHQDALTAYRGDAAAVPPRPGGIEAAAAVYQVAACCDAEEARQIAEIWIVDAGYVLPDGPAEAGSSDDAKADADPLDDWEERATDADKAAPLEQSRRVDADPEAQPNGAEVRDIRPPPVRKVLGHKIETVFFRLSDDEALDRGHELAMMGSEIAEAQSRHDQLKAAAKAEMSALLAKRERLEIIVRDRKEARSVRLEIEADYEQAVVREIVEVDRRVHAQRPMRDDERQTPMFDD